MTMTSFDLVRAAINFTGPERLPACFGEFGTCDTVPLPVRGGQDFNPALPDGFDEWGCEWIRTEVPNMGQPKGHPIKDITDISGLRPPDWNPDSRYTDVPAAIEKARREGKYTMASIWMLIFERMHALCGFENVLVALYTEREAAERLADAIIEVQLSYIRNLQNRFGSDVHGFILTDDWGTQQAPFISMDMWMDFFFPRYKRIFDQVHAGGQDVWIHCCGNVTDIIEGFIQAGMDVVNATQYQAMGIEELGRRYAGRVAFMSGVDHQRTLIGEDPAKITAEVEQLSRHIMTPKGGFIASGFGGDVTACGLKNHMALDLHMYRCFSDASNRLYGQPLPEPKV